MLVAMVALASCGSNDEPTSLAEKAVGSYNGFTTASCTYFSNMVADNQSIAMTSTEFNKVNISYQSDSWGTFTINGAELSGNEENIRISGSGKTMMGNAGNAAYDSISSSERPT